VDIEVPADLAGRTVLAFLNVNTETGALAFMNGQPIAGIDRHHQTIQLAENAREGDRFEIILETVTSFQDDKKRVFEFADIAAIRPEVWSFYWDIRQPMTCLRFCPLTVATDAASGCAERRHQDSKPGSPPGRA
jgi:hypothetical protein